MPVTQETYRAVAIEDPEGHWELFLGRLREKPSMSVPHNRIMARLASQLVPQLDVDQYEVRMNTGRLRHTDETYFIPDLHIVPVGLFHAPSPISNPLEVLSQPMPLVVEVWSPSTGDYDVDKKIPEYLKRGDREVWRLHPYERDLKIWTRRSDGGFDERVVTTGIVTLSAIRGVSVDVDTLFALN